MGFEIYEIYFCASFSALLSSYFVFDLFGFKFISYFGGKI